MQDPGQDAFSHSQGVKPVNQEAIKVFRPMTENDQAPVAANDEPGSLAGVRLLSPLSAEERNAVESQCRWVKARAGEEILNKECENRDVFFVVDGTVAIKNYSLSGREVAFATVEGGGYFGELSAIDGKPRSANVIAATECHLAALEPEVFRALLEKQPMVSLTVLQKMAAVVRDCDERIMDLATLSAYQRVYSQLIKMAREDPVRPESWLIYPLPTQAQIAAEASTTRETVARVLSQLSQSEIAERKSKTLYIREIEKLRTLCERIAPATA